MRPEGGPTGDGYHEYYELWYHGSYSDVYVWSKGWNTMREDWETVRCLWIGAYAGSKETTSLIYHWEN